MPKPSWRKIESVLIELLREEGLELKQVLGETSVTIYLQPSDDDYDYPHTISLADFAQQLEERL